MTIMKSAISLGSALGARELARSIQNTGANDVLGIVGLERKRSTMAKVLPALGWFGLGTALGAGAALMLAPSSGKQLRARVAHQLDEAKQRLGKDLESLEEQAAVRGNGHQDVTG